MVYTTELSSYLAAHQEDWKASGIWRDRTLADDAEFWSEQRPNEPVVLLEDGSHLTYKDAFDEAVALAVAIQARGLKSGDVLSFQLPNWREVAPLNIAASLLGLVLCPIIPIYRSKELQFILKASGSKMHFSLDSYNKVDYREMLSQLHGELTELQEIVYVRPTKDNKEDYASLVKEGAGLNLDRPTVDPDSLKILFYTSGTTGTPKGVMHTHNTLRCLIDNMAELWQTTEQDVMFMPSPVTHLTGLACGLDFAFGKGLKVALMERWDAKEAVALINRVKATLCVSATPFLQELLTEARLTNDGLDSLRLFTCGGAAVPPTLIEETPKLLTRCRAARVYGSSESPMVGQGFFGGGDAHLAAHTDGKICNFDVKVVDSNDDSVHEGDEGEILVRGPGMLIGYLDADHNMDAFDDAGYWRSGDLGYVTPEHAIVITGRKKDLIIRGGENLSAKEIEDVLEKHTDIREAAVVSMPHPRLGEGVCAYVIPADLDVKLSLESLKTHCEFAGLAKQKWPEHIEVVGDLPRTPTGKVKKNELRDEIREIIENSAG